LANPERLAMMKKLGEVAYILFIRIAIAAGTLPPLRSVTYRSIHRPLNRRKKLYREAQGRQGSRLPP
jgi:hypothetical protein